jgi:uncharacterized membrane protein
MTKLVFMQKLNGALDRLKPEERREILSDFEEHFANGVASGKTEEEVARELGDPEVLAAQYTEGLPEPIKPVQVSGVAQGVLAAFGLLLFNAMIALPVIAGLFAVWISMWSVVVALLAAAFACMVAPFIPLITVPAPPFLAGVGVFMLGIALLALTVLAGIGMVYVTKWCYKGLAAYVKAHIRIIKGGSLA